MKRFLFSTVLASGVALGGAAFAYFSFSDETRWQAPFANARPPVAADLPQPTEAAVPDVSGSMQTAQQYMSGRGRSGVPAGSSASGIGEISMPTTGPRYAQASKAAQATGSVKAGGPKPHNPRELLTPSPYTTARDAARAASSVTNPIWWLPFVAYTWLVCGNCKTVQNVPPIVFGPGSDQVLSGVQQQPAQTPQKFSVVVPR